MKYEKDIKDWTKQYAIRIVKITVELKKQAVEFALRDQLLRSGTSIGPNVKEAKASSSRNELIRFYEIALRSADETEYWMDIIEEGYNLNKEIFSSMKKELKEIMNVVASIIINLKK